MSTPNRGTNVPQSPTLSHRKANGYTYEEKLPFDDPPFGEDDPHIPHERTDFVIVDNNKGYTFVHFFKKGSFSRMYRPTNASLRRLSSTLAGLGWGVEAKLLTESVLVVYEPYQPPEGEVFLDLAALIESTVEQVYGSDERALLKQFLERNDGADQVVLAYLEEILR